MTTVDQNGCFASDRTCEVEDLNGDRFVTKYDLKGAGPFCYALGFKEFRTMVKKGYCGTTKCPFYKKTRETERA